MKETIITSHSLFKSHYSKVTIMTFLFWIPFLSISFAQVIETGNKIDGQLNGSVITEDNSIYKYAYELKSSARSQQNIWSLRVIFDFEPVFIKDIYSPLKNWKISKKVVTKPFWISWWSATKEVNLSPGNSLSGFSFNASYLPGIVNFYMEGEHQLPSFPEGSAPDFVPGYDDLTPYGPGVVGKTIGPTAPPADFKPLDFINYIINMKHEAYKLGWIKNEGILKSLDAKLENAKKDIEKGNTRSAKNILKAFINEVEAQGCENYENCPSGKHLTSEAYGLLKYNALYLIDHL